MHRGFGGVWFTRAEHSGRVGQSSYGGAKKGHFPFGQRYQAVNSQVEQTPKVTTDLVLDLDCNVWVDDVFYFAEDEISLLCLLDEFLGRLESVGLFVAAHKCTFFARELVWCGKCILIVSCRMIPPVSKV